MNILTFDLEDWFHILDIPGLESVQSWTNLESRVERNSERILSLLDEKKQKATWFCLGWIAKKYPSLIRKISEKHEIAIHSMNHQLLFRQNAGSAREDIRESIHLLEDTSGRKVRAYRAPGFSFTRDTKWLIEILVEAGIEYDCSIFPMKRNHGGYKTFPVKGPCRLTYKGMSVKEFPMNTSTMLGKRVVYSGGGYFRLLPYSIIKSMMKNSDYVMTYFHPRDFDPEQPVLNGIPFKRKLMSYTGLKKSFSKLNHLLNDYKFISLEEASLEIDWESMPLVNLDKY